LTLNAEFCEQSFPFSPDEFSSVVSTYELDAVSLRAVEVIGCCRESLEAGECIALTLEGESHGVAGALVDDQQMVQLLIDACCVWSTQVHVDDFQGPFCSALIWNVMRSVCRVVFADRA
jgi:hypothetical protein